MLLTIDIGNSNIVLGVFKQKKCIHHFRLETSVKKQSRDFEMIIRDYFLENDLSLSDIKRSIMSSVVPNITPTLNETINNLLGKYPLLIQPDVYPRLQLGIDRPHEIGTDLVANAVAAYNEFQNACIVIDFGTALTFTTVSKEGKILGVAIAPGLKTAMYALFVNTAQLPEVPLKLPDSAIGKNTTHALQSGVLLGYVGLVKEIIKTIKLEIGENCNVIATGGLSEILPPLENEFDKTDKLLTLNGLRIIDEYYQKN